jgi:hypothetical protein
MAAIVFGAQYSDIKSCGCAEESNMGSPQGVVSFSGLYHGEGIEFGCITPNRIQEYAIKSGWGIRRRRCS